MEKKEANLHQIDAVVKEIISSLEWNEYTGNEEKDVDPCNRDQCLVQLENGKYAFDSQYCCGEWDNDNVKRWAFIDPNELLNRLIYR